MAEVALEKARQGDCTEEHFEKRSSLLAHAVERIGKERMELTFILGKIMGTKLLGVS